MPIVVEIQKRFHAEDLFAPGFPEKFVELIEGELIVMTPSGWDHNEIAYHFVKLFDKFCETHPGLHFAVDNTGFLLQRDPDVMLCPDAALFKWRPRGKRPWMEFAPEIAVEVLSPSNSPAEVSYKRQKYFEAGSEQVWIALPEIQTLEFYFRDGRRILIQGDEIAKCEGIASGLQIDLKKLFAVRTE